MTTPLARFAHCTESDMPESIELIHCADAGRIVGIRLDAGHVLRIYATLNYRALFASESTVRYVLGRQAEKERDDAVDTETERLAEVAETERLDHQAELLKLENDVSEWKQRAAGLADELEERQSRVEELCERIVELEARA